MKIGLYEDWMKPQIAELFSQQYGVSSREFSELMDNFYEHPFQNNKCIRIVALEDRNVIGFQSFFYWPYKYNNKVYNSYQSGNSLVHPNYRGKGVFQKLLNYLDNNQAKFKIDFLIGFPVEESKNSFIRNGWFNILNLNWYIKLINPFGFLFSKKKLKNLFNSDFQINDLRIDNESVRLYHSEEFLDWRNSYSLNLNYLHFEYSELNERIIFQIKFNKRNRFLNELVIGDIITNSNNKSFIRKGFKRLHNQSLKAGCISIISIAINDYSKTEILNTILASKYIKTKKSIYFIIKPFKFSELLKLKENWILYRSDIDTW